jgi:hypothetical protein
MPVPLLPSIPLLLVFSFGDAAAAMRGDVALLLSLLLVLLLLGVPGRPNKRSSIKSGPLPLLAAAVTPRLLLLLLLLMSCKLPSGPPAALGASWL